MLLKVEKDKADIIVQIPSHFEKDLVKENKVPLFMAVNAINGVKAILGASYLQAIVQDFNNDVREDWIQMSRFSPQTTIEITSSNFIVALQVGS